MKGTHAMRNTNTKDRGMDPDMPLLRRHMPSPSPEPIWRGRRARGGGWAGLMPTVDEFFGTSTQVCGGFWPFVTDMALPVEGVPIGRSMATGAGVCCDPISWFRAGIIEQPVCSSWVCPQSANPRSCAAKHGG